MDKETVSCPFCGMEVTEKEYAGLRHPSNTACTLGDVVYSFDQWQMRPPKKEQPAMTSEVEYLRGLLEKLILKEPAKPPYTGLRGDLRSELFKTIGPGEVK